MLKQIILKQLNLKTKKINVFLNLKTNHENAWNFINNSKHFFLQQLNWRS